MRTVPSERTRRIGIDLVPPFILYLMVCVGAGPANASAYLADWCFNVNGDISVCNGAVSGSASVDTSGFDRTLFPSANSLGHATITLNPGNNQFARAYIDYDLNFPVTGSFFDFGSTHGARPAGTTFEIDNANSSPVFTDFQGGGLTNQNNAGVPHGAPNSCCDVAWALSEGGIDVPNGFQALVTFTVSATAPVSGFYLQQTNVLAVGANGESIYLSADVTLVPTTAPEPASIALLSSGAALLGFRRRRSRDRR